MSSRATRRKEAALEPTADVSPHYDVEHRAIHLERPGFRINELRISPSQSVPWHYHSHVRDTFYVLEGRLRILLRAPEEEVRLDPGESFSVAARRPHHVANAGDDTATFLVLQGLGEYDFVLLV
jgi:quercetin dioxygenase-like cupin family protein